MYICAINKLKMNKIIIYILLLCFPTLSFAQDLDPLWEIWKHEHGVTIEEFKNESGEVNYYITWSSSAYDSWEHDIYNTVISFKPDGDIQVISPTEDYISKWEAQEPVSTAIDPALNNLISVFEDGSDSNIPNEEVNIRAQIHKPDGTIIKKDWIVAGGPGAQHSAVATHLGNRFIAIYGDDAPPAEETYLRLKAIDVASGFITQTLDLTPPDKYNWWPVVASNNNHKIALVVWVHDIDVVAGSIIKYDNGQIKALENTTYLNGIQFVNQQINWLEKFSEFVVIAKSSTNNSSKICLVDTLGNKTKEVEVTGGVFQEAKPAVKWDELSQSYIYVYPVGSNDLNVLKVSKNNIRFNQTIIGDNTPVLSAIKWKATGIWSKFVKDIQGKDKWDNKYKILFAMGNYSTNDINLIPVSIDKNILSVVPIKSQADEIKIIPNPINKQESFVVDLSHTKISKPVSIFICNLNGHAVFKRILTQNQSKFKFSSKKLTPGIYVVTIRMNKNVFVKKIIVI